MTLSMFKDAPETWTRTTLGEIVARGGGTIQTGPFGSQLHASDYVSLGVPSIMPVNIGDNRLIREGIACISEEDAQRLSRHIVRKGDIIYSRRGDVERRALVREEEDGWFCGTGCLKVRLGDGVVSPEFAAYYLGHPEVREWLVRHAVGATMPNLNTSIMEAVPFLLPPPAEQDAIAATLGVLDDKIEQHRRTGRALEGLARATFKAWFVDLEPVRAKAAGNTCFPGLPPAAFAALPDRVADSMLGPVPEGWSVGKLGDVLSERGERMRPGEETRRLPYVPIDCITPRRVTLETFKSGDEAQSSLIRFRSGDILFGAMRPYFHKVCLAPFVGTTRTTCFVLTPRVESDTAFSLMLASEDTTVQFASTHSVGSTIPYARWEGSLREMPCLLPPESLRAAFETVADPMLQLSNQGICESFKLAALRDYLLPRLLSGRVRVANVERAGGQAL